MLRVLEKEEQTRTPPLVPGATGFLVWKEIQESPQAQALKLHKEMQIHVFGKLSLIGEKVLDT